MVVDCIFSDQETAFAYAKKQPGVMGRTFDGITDSPVFHPAMDYRPQYAYSIGQRKSNPTWSFLDWDVEEVKVLNKDSFELNEDVTRCWNCGAARTPNVKYCGQCGAFVGKER